MYKRQYKYRPTNRRGAQRVDLRQTNTTLSSDSTCRGAEAQSGTARRGPHSAGQHMGVRFTSNAHNPRLGQHTSSTHSPGRSTILDFTYWPTYSRAAQRVRFTSNANNPRLGQHMSSGMSTIRDYKYRPTYRRGAQRVDLRQTNTTLCSDSTCRGAEAPSGTARRGPRSAGQHMGVRFTSNAHNPRLGQHTSRTNSPGRSTIRDCTYLSLIHI